MKVNILHFVLVSSVLFGCGDGMLASPPPAHIFSSCTIDGGAADGGVADGGVADGGPSIINVQSGTPNPILLTSPAINLVFWGSWWKGNNASTVAITDAWQTLANDPNFYAPMSEYGIGSGTLNGIYFANSNLQSGPLTETYIKEELLAEITNNTLPPSNSNSIYAILLSPNNSSVYDSQLHFNGHHGYLSDNYTVFAEVEYFKSSESTNIALSHEVYESATDPLLGNAYIGIDGNEIGDYCQSKGEIYTLDGHSVQKLWSQSQCKCIP